MKKRDMIKGIVVLIAITVFSGYLLAQVYKVAQPKIEEQKRIEKERLNREIFPEGIRFAEEKINGLTCTAVYDTQTAKLDAEENLVGRIFDIRVPGYGGSITVKAGLDREMKIRSVRISDHTETPGLGSKIADRNFLSQFNNREASSMYLTKDNPAGKIDGVTGATVSSRAVTDGIRQLQEKLK
jgi:Na+-translocating ferredoxin:NAD+ oxidoreductase subunit G